MSRYFGLGDLARAAVMSLPASNQKDVARLIPLSAFCGDLSLSLLMALPHECDKDSATL